MEKLLITGAGGFFGSAILTQLNGKYEIIAATSGRRKSDFPECVQEETANLLDPQSIDQLLSKVKPDIVLHLAWGRQDGAARNSADNIAWLEASCKLLRAFIENGGRRFVFAGTSSEYESESGLHQELPSAVQMSMYGETKKAFSDVARNYCQRAGIEFVDARFFTLYGENDRHATGCAL